ncbi:hypothetical protein J6590_074636 [Homalodisca vitripennis]|nr:hypothetical protein J6590_074636 [Homalodisca vitripennis]
MLCLLLRASLLLMRLNTVSVWSRATGYNRKWNLIIAYQLVPFRSVDKVTGRHFCPAFQSKLRDSTQQAFLSGLPVKATRLNTVSVWSRATGYNRKWNLIIAYQLVPFSSVDKVTGRHFCPAFQSKLRDSTQYLFVELNHCLPTGPIQFCRQGYRQAFLSGLPVKATRLNTVSVWSRATGYNRKWNLIIAYQLVPFICRQGYRQAFLSGLPVKATRLNTVSVWSRATGYNRKWNLIIAYQLVPFSSVGKVTGRHFCPAFQSKLRDSTQYLFGRAFLSGLPVKATRLNTVSVWSRATGYNRKWNLIIAYQLAGISVMTMKDGIISKNPDEAKLERMSTKDKEDYIAKQVLNLAKIFYGISSIIE